MQFRPILFALSLMTMLLGLAMIPCALVDHASGRTETPAFAISAFLSLLAGGLVFSLVRGPPPRTGQREAFLLTVLVWLVLPAIAAVPFMLLGLSVTDAVFESVSGLTTTGSTVLTGLDNRAPGLLLWRAILQWIGGIGIIVTAIAILPSLRVGGMQLFQIESSDQSGKFLPRLSEIALQVGAIYLITSVSCALAYSWSGMSAFDAIAHAMTTVSAGGFSTHDASFSYFSDTPAPYFAIFFMFVAGLPFSLLALALLNGKVENLLKDPQPRLYLAVILAGSLFVVGYHELEISPASFDTRLQALREATFNIISVMTGTGYASASYDSWGQPVVALFLITTFLGGCAGSAACGIKMFRLEITVKAIHAQIRQIVHPHRVSPVRYGRKTVDEDTLQSVMVFVFLYIAVFLVSAALLGTLGLDALTAISAAATSISNVGPGLGPVVGPSGTFQTLPGLAKWICSVTMLLGRLELVPVFVVLTRRFWVG